MISIVRLLLLLLKHTIEIKLQYWAMRLRGCSRIWEWEIVTNTRAPACRLVLMV